MHAFGDDALRLRLRLIAFALADDEWMPQLRSGREFRRTDEMIYTAAELDPRPRPATRASGSRPWKTRALPLKLP